MKGARAEVSVKIIKKPNRSKIIMIGPSQNFFLTFINAQNSMIRLMNFIS